jgi:hypothetical protein
MSRSAAARTQHHDERAVRRARPIRPHGLPHARRISGPARPAYATAPPGHPRAQAQMHASAYAAGAPAYAPRIPARPVRPPLRLAAGGARVALRVAESALEASHSRTMDRLVRSRAWVVIIGVGLIGIVAMQVSMLKLNSGIGRAVDTVDTLQRGNAALQATVSELSDGDRIQRLAGARGFVMPEPADVTYLSAGDKRSDSLRAVRAMIGPDPAIAGPAGALSAVKLPDSLTAPPDASGTAPPAATGQTAAPTSTIAVPTPTPTPTPAPAAAAPAAATPAPTATATATPTGAAATATAAPPPPQTTATGGVTTP